MKEVTKLKNEQGNTMIIVLLLLLVLTAVGSGLLAIAGVDIDIAANQRSGESALYFADAGIRDGLSTLNGQIDSGDVDLSPSLGELIAEKAMPKSIKNTMVLNLLFIHFLLFLIYFKDSTYYKAKSR